MSESTESPQYGKLLVRAVVVFLVVISVAAAYSTVRVEGLTPAVVGNIVVTLYISAIVCYGVFWEAMAGRRFRLALYFGVVLWGSEQYLFDGGTLLSVALILGGLGLFARELYFRD